MSKTLTRQQRLDNAANAAANGQGGNQVIPGLQPVVAAPDAPVQPTLLTSESMQKLSDSNETDLRFFEYGIPVAAVVDSFLAVQAALQFASNTNRNPSLIGIEDFSIGACKTTNTNTPAGYADPGPTLVFLSRESGKLVVAQAYPPAGVKNPLAIYHQATATALVEAYPTPKPEGAEG